MPTFTKTSTVVTESSEFADPEIFFEYKGVKIYHTYIEGGFGYKSISQDGATIRSNFHISKTSKRLFSTNRKCGFVPMFDIDFNWRFDKWIKQPKNEINGVFNIQNIPNPKGHHITTYAGISRVLMEAIDSGWIKSNKTPECIHDCHIIAHPR